jgi:hypothetical protein
MSAAFILGAGFSKAISEEMPLTDELSKQVLDRYRHTDAITQDVRLMIEEAAR